MEKSKALFGEAQSIVEQTRTKPTGMIRQSIEPKKVKKAGVNHTAKKNISNNIKKPNSFSK